MIYYWFNRQDLLKKAKEKYHKEGGIERAAKYYKDTKETIKKKARNKYKNFSKDENEKKREYSRNRYYKLKQQYKG